MVSWAYTYQRIDKNNAALLVVDLQEGLYHMARDFSPVELKSNILAHAELAKIFNLPTILTTSAENGECPAATIAVPAGMLTVVTGQNGPLPQEILDMHPNAAYIRRQGEVDAYDNAELRAAIKATGKKQIILAGVTTDVRAQSDACTMYR